MRVMKCPLFFIIYIGTAVVIDHVLFPYFCASACTNLQRQLISIYNQFKEQDATSPRHNVRGPNLISTAVNCRIPPGPTSVDPDCRCCTYMYAMNSE